MALDFLISRPCLLLLSWDMLACGGSGDCHLCHCLVDVNVLLPLCEMTGLGDCVPGKTEEVKRKVSATVPLLG